MTTAVAARTTVATGSALIVAGTGLSAAAGDMEHWWSSHTSVVALFSSGICVLVWLVAPRQPGNRAVRVLAVAGLGGVTVLAFAVLPVLAGADPASLSYPGYVPAEHSTPVASTVLAGELAATVAVFVPLTFGLLLFPDGRLPSRRWRPVGWSAGASVGAVCLGYAYAGRPGHGGSPERSPAVVVPELVLVVAVLASVAALAVRWRASAGDVRQQCKWVMWGAAVAALGFLIGIATVDVLPAPASPALIAGGFAVLTASYGLAIGRYRLYGVDLVISRTIVFVALAGAITAGYVGTVVGIGSLVGRADRAHTALAVTATTMVAVAFQPMRRHLQRVADRMVFGLRATPHEVLSELSRRVTASDDRFLERVARSMVEGTGASAAEVVVRREGRPAESVAWPPGRAHGPAAEERFPVRHGGALLGSLILRVEPGQRLSEQDRLLAEQVASGMGLALRNRALTESLERRVAELRESRLRLVAVQDDTRRRLERDLHDGVQQQLVALRVKLGLARSQARREGAARTVRLLERPSAAADAAVEAVRVFARVVHPPLLESEGLGPALAAHARDLPVPVALHAGGLGRYDRSVESTVNACVVEALRDVTSRAAAKRAVVTIAEEDGVLSFEVRGDGVGRRAVRSTLGARMSHLADRVDALGGSLAVAADPGAGTIVSGRIPATRVSQLATAPATGSGSPEVPEPGRLDELVSP